LFDIKEEYHRSLPHYDEALKIKNVIAGFGLSQSITFLAPASVNPKENVDLVLQSLDEDLELPQVSKATLSVSLTHKQMAAIYTKVSDPMPLDCLYSLRFFSHPRFFLSENSKTSFRWPFSTTLMR
jgi:hypothetical protein